MSWITFIVSATAIFIAGIRLTTYADRLSERLHIGKVWIGVVLLGLVTSLPEAITSLVSVVYLNADDLAVGNLLGSNAFNPMIIVVLDFIYRQGSVTSVVKTNRSHEVSAFFAIALSSIVLMEILVQDSFSSFHIGPLSLGSIAIAVLYFVGMRRLALLGKGQDISAQEESDAGKAESLFSIIMNLLFCAVVVIIAAMFLSQSADVIAESTGLGRTFVGSIFLAFATSLPEIVVSVSALRLGSLDLAIGNIFGSNMTNMFIVFLCSIFHKGQLLLSAVDQTHCITAAVGIILAAAAYFGIDKKKKTFFSLGWDSLFMIVVFVVGMRMLYILR